ncbi:hypothetical protein AURDEDRAFT_175664 [Auricularia subglabra TFB-10046 SS5]|uniref:Zn(2)-C6 fungal-type domain-containing protein n=1 Tax=Auricularia subglabra (strain TFB-10046 / SS5) TaxID=717982 RepID=J0WSS5_AURST|nr:hypothetical protein AURDEDRAFT_175664 [Auricularia subglabra TFB-10046 SS5]
MHRTARNASHCTSACNGCRTKKIKCSGGPPLCAACAQHGRECGWRLDGDRRTVRGRERTLQQLETDIARLESENALLKAELALAKELLCAGAKMTIQPDTVSYAHPTDLVGVPPMPDYFPHDSTDAFASISSPPSSVAQRDTTYFALAPHAVENVYPSIPEPQLPVPSRGGQAQEIPSWRAAPPSFAGDADHLPLSYNYRPSYAHP